MDESCRRSNDGSPLEVESSTAGASGAGDHEMAEGTWTVEIPGGPAFAINAAAACRAMAMEGYPGPRRDCMSRLADALDRASYRRSNDSGGQEVEPSTAGATGSRDLDAADKLAGEFMMLGAVTSVLHSEALSVTLPDLEQAESAYLHLRTGFLKSRYRLTVTLDPEEELRDGIISAQ